MKQGDENPGIDSRHHAHKVSLKLALREPIYGMMQCQRHLMLPACTAIVPEYMCSRNETSF